ncbi:MAG: UDP-N-acetylmuramate--L-alanine ligase [Mariniphaga sp.]
MTEINQIKRVYLLGIGGIGMSALARYFRFIGKVVDGYDKTSSPLTLDLENEGIPIHYTDDLLKVPTLEEKDTTLVIYTPAVPYDFQELRYFMDNSFQIHKRSQVLGLLTEGKKCIAIAGTHGKTSVTTMTAHLLKQSAVDCSAFMGGISKNYKTNLLLSDRNSPFIVVEADEFDRSFLQLHPDLAVITWMDADHLDIYGDHESMVKAFAYFVMQIKMGGTLVYRKGSNIDSQWNNSITYYSYSISEEADFQAINIQIIDGAYHFDLKSLFGMIEGLSLSYPGLMNVENAVAACSMALISGVTGKEICEALPKYTGVVRRFDVRFAGKNTIYIDDYAHHPRELEATIRSVRDLYPGKRVTGIFQPHLFTRTRDFADEFASALDLLDDALVMEIYPARELPIEGVDSEMILGKMTLKSRRLCQKNEFPEVLGNYNLEILLTLGAGDIDRLIDPIVTYLRLKDNV